MGGIKSKVSMHSGDQIELDLSLQVEAKCMLYMGENKLKTSMHSDDRVRFKSQTKNDQVIGAYVNRVGNTYVSESSNSIPHQI